MIIKSETSLEYFEFWSGAKQLAEKLSSKEFDTIEAILSEEYPDGMDATGLNDLFAYDGDTIASWLGYEKEDDILYRDDPEYIFKKVVGKIEYDLESDNFEFEFSDPEVIRFLSEKNMSQDDFIDHGWKEFAADVYEEIPMEDIDDAGYEDTIEHLKVQKFTYDVNEAIEAKNFTAELRDRIVEMLDEVSLPSCDFDEIEKMKDELNDLALEDKEAER